MRPDTYSFRRARIFSLGFAVSTMASALLIASPAGAAAKPKAGNAPAAEPRLQLELDRTVLEAEGAQPGLAVPPEPVRVILVQSALAALNHADMTGDYTVLAKLGSTNFQRGNSAAQLAAGFKALRDARTDLSPVLIYPIRWTYAPSIQNGALRLVGSFATRPQEVTFDLSFVIESGAWRLAAVSAGLGAPVK